MPQTCRHAGPAPDTNGRDAEGRRLRHGLRQSLRQGAFTLSFRTRRRLSDQARLGADAQVKWRCRGRGVVQASTLMPILRECGLAGELLAWSLREACQAACTWPDGLVSIGVPALAARDGSLLTLMGQALAETGLDAERIEISLFDNDVAGDCADTLLALSALRDLGLGVALEAFGRTGACLIKLRHLPLTAIKLDCALVRDLALDGAAAAMTGGVIGFARRLGIESVAAVEDAHQREMLLQLGCDAGIERGGES